MNEFEKLLLEQHSQYMILLFAKIYQNETSQEFKDYVAEHFQNHQGKEELLKMPIKDFFNIYAKTEYHKTLSKLTYLFAVYDIKTVDELLKYSIQDLARTRSIGAKTIEVIVQAFANAGLKFK